MIYKILLITRKTLTSLKNNKLKLSGISGISNMVHGKKKKKKTPKRRKSTESFVKQDHPLLTFGIARQLVKSNQFGIYITFWLQEQAKLLSIENTKLTLTILSKSLLYVELYIATLRN